MQLDLINTRLKKEVDFELCFGKDQALWLKEQQEYRYGDWQCLWNCINDVVPSYLLYTVPYLTYCNTV